MALFLAILGVLAGPFLQFISHQYTAADGLPDRPINRVVLHQGEVYAEAGSCYKLIADRWREAACPDALREAPADLPDLSFPARYYLRQPIPNTDANARSMTIDKAGHRWIGTDQGIIVTTGDDYLFSIAPGPGGLPYHDVTALALDKTTEALWVGFSEGAALWQHGRWRYFWGRRWLPGNRVQDVVSDGNGGAWLATDQGIAHLEARLIDFETKARHYEAINASRHNRYGYTTDCSLRDPEDLGTCRYQASDNDGLWTALTVAAESFRYAATGEEEAKQLARTSMRALLELVYKSGAPGFPARALARIGEENVILSDFNEDRWKPSPVAGWRYKTDTSSDEIDGHYFAWYIYSELVADEQEKAEIAQVCKAVTDRILDDGLLLLRPDGQRTTWGVWAPATLNDDPRWWQERALNAMEILSHLRVALHLTGEERYGRAYDDLIQRHHYLLNAAEGRVIDPPEVINHSDDELWFLAYYPIGMIEQDPAHRRLILMSLERSWATIRPEHSPLYTFIYGAITQHPVALREAAETLARWPWDLRRWTFKNSHRLDLQRAPHSSRKGRALATTPLPPDERSGVKWNQNPYEMDGGNGGRSEADAAGFLLPYWMGRYYDFIED